MLVLRHYLGSEAVGQYALAYQLMGAVQQIPMLSFPVVVPYLVAAWVAERPSTIQLYLDRVVPHAIFAMVLVLVVGALAGPRLVSLIFGQAFAPAGQAFPVLLLGVGWYCLFIVYMPILNLRERTQSMLRASVLAAAANVIGDLVLVPRYGIVGAAWATVLSQAVGALFVAHAVTRDYRVSVPPLLLLLAPLVVVVTAVTLEPSPLLAAVATALAGGLLIVAARHLHLGSPADRRLLAGMEVPGLRRFLNIAEHPR